MPCLNMSVSGWLGAAMYIDHKLPSVATRDLEHAGHDLYLAL